MTTASAGDARHPAPVMPVLGHPAHPSILVILILVILILRNGNGRLAVRGVTLPNYPSLTVVGRGRVVGARLITPWEAYRSGEQQYAEKQRWFKLSRAIECSNSSDTPIHPEGQRQTDNGE